MRRRGRREINAFSVSFLDVLANTIGGLAFLLVMAMLMVGAIVNTPPTILTTTLPTGYEGRKYETWLAAREGMGKFQWSVVSGSLPPGLEIDKSTGRLSGTVSLNETSKVSHDFTFEVECLGGSSGRQSADRYAYSLRVERKAPVESVPLRLVTQSPLPDSYLGQPYPLSFAAEGGQAPYTWRISGNPPPGIALTPAGQVSGAPSKTGVFVFDIAVATPAGERAAGTYRLTVLEKSPVPPPIPPLVITTKRLPDGVAERTYGVWLSAEGGAPPYTWQPVRGQPRWLVQLANESNGFGGTPGLFDIGSSDIVWAVTDTAGRRVDSSPIHLEVLPPSGENPPPLRLKTSSLPEGRVEEKYEIAISADGGFPPYSWTSMPMSLLDGISFDAKEGTFSGVPKTAGKNRVDVTVTDRAGQIQTASWPLRIRPPIVPLQIITTTAPVGRAQADYNLALSAAGGIPPYTWKLNGADMPPGLSLDEASGVVHGVPEVAGDYVLRVSVSDAEGASGSGAQEFPLEIRTWKNLRPLRILTQDIPVLLLGEEQRVALACEGGEPPYRWGSSEALPDGLRIEDGQLLGTPAVATHIRATLRVEDAAGESAEQKVTLSVRHIAPFWLAVILAASTVLTVAVLLWLLRKLRSLHVALRRPLIITTQQVPNARASSWYSVQLACEGGLPPFVWRVVDGALPPGMGLSPDGVISGYPFKGINVDEKKNAPFTVEVTDSRGDSARQAL